MIREARPTTQGEPAEMTREYRFDAALLPDGWARDVRLSVADDGRICGIAGAAGAAPDRAAAVEHVAGIAIPGMPNAHSHSFQRAMAGAAEYRRAGDDSFWTWRDAMYGLANDIEPADLEIIATQLFIEMLKSGYTSVAEFHYLNRRRDGAPYGARNELWEAVDAAAHAAGIGLTFLPTLYQHADFGARPLRREQARFALETEAFLRAIELRVAAARGRPPANGRTGAAFHSLRAVALDTLRHAATALARIDPSLPLHIHVAEQNREVEACLQATGRRPVQALLDTGAVDGRWCLVHATHANAAELRGVAAAGATVCLAVTTEANLGDGFFETERFLGHAGRVCIGSDSQISVSPSEELRWLEYQQRLRKRRRGVLASALQPHVGTRLWVEAAQHGAQALGRSSGALCAGRLADLLVVDPAHDSLAGATLEETLDRLVFAGAAAAIRAVMVGGRWVVRDGRHPQEAAIAAKFRECLRTLRGRASI